MCVRCRDHVLLFLTMLKCFCFLDPLELPITKREVFNRWYSTSAYYLAMVVSDVPIVLACSLLYLFLIYFMTNQPLESFRAINFILIGILTKFVAQSFGLLIGSMFEVKVKEFCHCLQPLI